KIRENPQLFKLAGYNLHTVHRKQMQFHACRKRNRWVFGGNRTGKTECGAVEAVWFARGIHPFRKITAPTKGWVVSLTQEVQRDVAQEKLLSYLPREWIEKIVMRRGREDSPDAGVIDFILVKSVHGGLSTIGFKSCDQGRQRFQGTSQNWIWFDEEPPKDIYDECRMRVLDTCGEIWGTMTPLMGLTWVHDEIYLNERHDPEAWYITMCWEDNPFLNAREVEMLKSLLPESERESRQYGHFMSHEGLVYREFDEHVHVIEPFAVPRDWYDNLSIDPGLVNPLSCHWYAVDGDGNIYVIAEHYAAGQDARWHCEHILAQCEALGWRKGYQGRVEALMDSAALQHTLSADKSVAQLFYELGISVNTRVNKNLWTGIQRVKQYLRTGTDHPRLFIFRSCPEMIREIKGYRYGAGDHPIKRDDHAMDELRYYIMSRPEPHTPKHVLSAVEREKERLLAMRKQKRLN
ncbi:MAG: terminase family protein, partial [Clostridia bacterium]|nr:terminase family protein [Clostridia bacterium]